MPPKAAEPTSPQPLPPLPSARGSGQSLPFHVAITDGGLEITARIKNEGDAENLIQILQTIKSLLQRVTTNGHSCAIVEGCTSAGSAAESGRWD